MKKMKTPIYRQIAEKLCEELWRFNPGETFFSDRDVAGKYSVNVLTARRAVMLLVENGQLERLPRKGTFVRDMVLEDSAAKASSSQGSVDTYRFIHYLPHSSIIEIDPYFSGIYTTCMQRMRRNGGDLIFSSLMSADDIQMLPKVIKERGERGVLLASSVGEALCKQLKANRNLHMIAIDNDYSHLGIDSVVWNTFEVGRQAAETLLAAGHQTLAFVGMKVSESVARRTPELSRLEQWPNAASLYQGFQQGIEDWQAQHQVSITHHYSSGDVVAFTEQLAFAENVPTGFFCFNGEHGRKLSNFMSESQVTERVCQFICWSEPAQQYEHGNALFQSVVSRKNGSILGHVAMQALQRRIEHPASPVRVHSLLPGAMSAL